jgi:hypothetical protein
MKLELEIKDLNGACGRGVKIVFWDMSRHQILMVAKGHTVIEALMMLCGNYKRQGTDLEFIIKPSGFADLPCDWQVVGGK